MTKRYSLQVKRITWHDGSAWYPSAESWRNTHSPESTMLFGAQRCFKHCKIMGNLTSPWQKPIRSHDHPCRGSPTFGTPRVESLLFEVAWSEDCGDTQLAHVERCLWCLRCEMQPHSLERHGRSWPCQVRVCCILVTRPWTRVSGPEMAWGYGWHSVMVYG